MRSEEEVIYSFELGVGGGGYLLRGGGHLYLKILVSAPVPFWVFWGWNWDGLGLGGLGTNGLGTRA